MLTVVAFVLIWYVIGLHLTDMGSPPLLTWMLAIIRVGLGNGSTRGVDSQRAMGYAHLCNSVALPPGSGFRAENPGLRVGVSRVWGVTPGGVGGMVV